VSLSNRQEATGDPDQSRIARAEQIERSWIRRFAPAARDSEGDAA